MLVAYCKVSEISMGSEANFELEFMGTYMRREGRNAFPKLDFRHESLECLWAIRKDELERNFFSV